MQISMARSLMPPAPRAGKFDDMEREDTDLGPERDETDSFHSLVRHLVADGDRRALQAGRRARRVLTDMVATGYTRPSLLTRTAETASSGQGR
ncbi:hypothetical protein ACODT5_00335 [Streptomyces sp. 5.8]|uniref:hypothetical protein n=1 Tax=unclassified Streptomyces TaxID=2593676 RepID=UPI0036F0551F